MQVKCENFGSLIYPFHTQPASSETTWESCGSSPPISKGSEFEFPEGFFFFFL